MTWTVAAGSTARLARRLAACATLVAVACAGDDSMGGDAGAADGTVGASGSEPAGVFPGDAWERGDPEELGFEAGTLDEIAAGAEANGSNCLVVVRHGLIAGEWYWNGTDADTTHDGFSVTKSFTSTLVGIAQEAGHLDIGDSASDYIDDWVGTPAEDVTIRNLLSNNSGRHSPLRDDLADLAEFTGAEDATAYAVGLAQDHPPGDIWSYNDPAIQTLDPILAAATRQEPAAYAQERIFDPIGATNTGMAEDPAGNTRMSSSIQTTCQDAARFGYLFLRNGDWDGTRVVSEEWVRDATAAPSQDMFAAYGYLWWLNRPSDSPLDSGAVELFADHAATVEGQTQLVPGAPADMYWAVGAFGQIIQVHPDTDTVVVRFGGPRPEGPSGLRLLGDTANVVTDALG